MEESRSRKRASQEVDCTVRSSVVQFHEPGEGILVEGGDDVCLVRGQDQGREPREENWEGIQLLNTKSGCRVGMMVESKASWKNREELVLVGREALHYVGHITRRRRADNTKMFSQIRKLNFLLIQYNWRHQLGVLDNLSIFILVEHHKFSLVWDTLDLVLVTVLKGIR